MHVLRFWGWFIGQYFRYLFRTCPRSRIIFENLFQGTTLRVDKQVLSHPLPVLSYWKKAMTLLIRDKMTLYRHEGEAGYGSLDGSNVSNTLQFNYLKGLDLPLPASQVSVNVLGGKGMPMSRLWTAVLLTVFLPAFIVGRYLAKNKANVALLQLTLAEATLISLWAKQEKLSYLYYFGSYEVEANLNAAWFMHCGIRVNRLPSPNPLEGFYQRVISTEFSFTAPYQEEEIYRYRENWQVETLNHFPCFTYTKLLRKNRKTAPEGQQTIGFLSSAVWLRRERGDNTGGHGEYESEDRLIHYLKQLLKEQDQLQLLIYLHPQERLTPELATRAQEVYRQLFDSKKVTIADPTKPSLESFDFADVVLSVYSSANIERLFIGKKTFYVPVTINLGLFQNSSLKRISLYEYEEVKQEVLQALELSPAEFFAKYDIEKYYQFGYPIIKGNN